MLEDPFYDIVIFDQADDFHLSGTFRAWKRVNFIILLNQPGPVSSGCPGRYIRFQDKGYPFIISGGLDRLLWKVRNAIGAAKA